MSEEKETFNCFGTCGQSGGVMQLVVAFGLADNHSEASRWLADRGIIPAPVFDGQRKPDPVPKAIYTDHLALDEEARTARTLSLLDIEEAVGTVRLRACRDMIAAERYKRRQKEDRMFTGLQELMVEPGVRDAVSEILSHPQGYERHVRTAILAKMPSIWAADRAGRCSHGLLYRDACEACGRAGFIDEASA